MPKPGLLEVVDFKYGQGTLVEVKGNSQLMYYALGAVVASNQIPARIRITVIQPRAPHPDGIIRSWVFEYAELKAFKNILFASAAASMEDDAPLTPGDWCKFCPALAICPAQHQRAQDVARTEFSAMVPLSDDVLLEVGEEQPALPAPEALTLGDLQEVMAAAPVYDAWIAAVRSHVRDLTEAGEETGYKLVPKRGRRLWKDEDVAERALVSALGEDAYAPRKLLSVTQAEKAARAATAMLPPDMWEMVSSGTNLVPLSDPREALPPPVKAADDFAVYDVSDPIQGNHGVLEVVDEASGGAAALVAMTLEEVEGLAKNFEVPANLEPGEIVYESPEEEAPEIIVNTWMVEAGDKMFFVVADSEVEAREVARAELGVSRLPNHTQLTPTVTETEREEP